MTLSYKEVGHTALEVYERVYEAHRNIKSLVIKPIKDTPGFYYVVLEKYDNEEDSKYLCGPKSYVPSPYWGRKNVFIG